MSRALAREIHELTLEGGVDFHLHSTASDGSEPASSLPRIASKAGLKAFSLTDHDSLAGLIPLVNEWEKLPDGNVPRFIPGVELSLELDDKKVHLLAYFPDKETALSIAPWLEMQAAKRHERNRRLEAALRREGVPFSLDKFLIGIHGQLGRPHVARWLVEHGYASDLNDAFARWLGSQGKCFVLREKSPLEEGIRVVQAAGGVTFVAHPAEEGWCRSLDLLREKLNKAKLAGVDGVEVFHGAATFEQRELIATVAKELDLCFSAGSDWHGRNKINTPHYTGRSTFVNYSSS